MLDLRIISQSLRSMQASLRMRGQEVIAVRTDIPELLRPGVKSPLP